MEQCFDEDEYKKKRYATSSCQKLLMSDKLGYLLAQQVKFHLSGATTCDDAYRTLITRQSILRSRDPEVLCNTSCCHYLFL